MPHEIQYHERVAQMVTEIDSFRNNNRTAVIQIQFNFPRSVGVISEVREAWKAGWISTNRDGQRLLDFVIGKDDTVMMLKAALAISGEVTT